MIYQSPLQIPTNYDESFVITIYDAFYTIDDSGKVEIALTTYNKQYESFNSKKYCTYQKIMYTNTEDIKPLDSFKIFVHIEGNICYEYWDLVSRVENSTKGISITKEPTRCPSCGKLLHGDTNNLFCYNSQCPAKIKITIRRFLLLATKEKWTQYELMVIDKLISSGRIQSVYDLYTLTLQEIQSSWYYESRELTNAKDLLDKIIRTKGTISVYNFLYSLNIPRNDQWYISKEQVDKDMPNMNTFMSWFMTAEDDEEYPISNYMTVETYSMLLKYLHQDGNREVWQLLNAAGIFAN